MFLSTLSKDLLINNEALVIQTGQWALNELENLFSLKGGLIDCHRHLDRQNTLDETGYKLITNNATLPQKWDYINEIKRTRQYSETLEQRMKDAISDMMRQGIRACRTYIDADTTINLEAIRAAMAVKKWARNNGFPLQIAASPVKGIAQDKDIRIFRVGCEYADVVGALPSRGRKSITDDETVRNNMKTFFQIAAEMKKPIDLQIDQANHSNEKESRILCQVARHFRDKGYHHTITATHCVSLGAQSAIEIKQVAKEFRELNIRVVVCPGAAISMLQDRNRQGPIRNSIAPVGELLEEGVAVALGTDNVSDIFMPFTNGDIREEIRELARAVRWQDDLSQFADIATRNGRLVMDLPLAEEREE